MKFYTKEDMLIYLKKHFPNISLEPKEINGFNCIHHFCELEKGWFPNHSEIDEYELSMVMKYDGSINDRKKWNQYSDFKLETSKKGFILEKKKNRVSKRNLTRHFNEKYGRKAFEAFIKELKKAGVPVLRRTKKDQYKGLYYFWIDRSSELFNLASGVVSDKNTAIVYIPNEKGYPFVGMDSLTSVKELVNLINDERKLKITESDIESKKIKFYIP